MAGDCIPAIDQGTTNTKGLLFDREGSAIFKTVSSVSLNQPRPGYIEQDPLELWQSTLDVMRACAAYAAEAGTKIAGVPSPINARRPSHGVP